MLNMATILPHDGYHTTMSYLLAILLAGIAGSLMAWQGMINSFLGRQLTLAHATFMVHLIGLLASAVALGVYLVMRAPGTQWAELLRAPWYAYLGGIMGVGIIWGVAASIGQIGATPATTAIIAFQVTTAALLDHFGLLHLKTAPITPGRGFGLVLLAIGAWLALRHH